MKSSANRQLAESTTTQVLDDLIAAYPQRLEYYRTRGIVHCFRDEYTHAIKDFTHALKEARSARKGRSAHRNVAMPTEPRGKNGKKKKKSNKTHGQAPPNGTSASADGSTADGAEPLLHASVLPDAPDPIEPQLLFLRGAAYLQQAIHLIESAALKLEGISKTSAGVDGVELRLCYLVNGRYGGVEIGNPDGPLGKSNGSKAQAYRGVLAEQSFRTEIDGYLRKCIRDHERFLAHFDTIEGPCSFPTINSPAELARSIETALMLTEIVRPGHPKATSNSTLMDSSLPVIFTTYHPLIVESHFNTLLCQLMLGELPTLLKTFVKTAFIVDGLEGYPVFLPPRSMAQAEFIEVLERLAAGWKVGILPYSAMRPTPVANRLAIEATALSPSPSVLEVSSSSGDTSSTIPVASSSSSSSSVSKETLSPPCHPPGRGTLPSERSVDLAESLQCARMLLVPVAARQKDRAGKAATEKAPSGSKRPLNLHIPLHGPRVEIILAWLAAVHLVELESIA